MSKRKKNWRRPANPDYKPPVAEGDGGAASAPVAQAAEPNVTATSTTSARKTVGGVPVPQFDVNVTEDEARGFLNEMARFLGAVVTTANRTLQSLPAGDVRDAVMGEDDETREKARKKLPKAHPVLGLMRYGISASRLLYKLLQLTMPQLFTRGDDHPVDVSHAAAACEQFLRGKLPEMLKT